MQFKMQRKTLATRKKERKKENYQIIRLKLKEKKRKEKRKRKKAIQDIVEKPI